MSLFLEEADLGNNPVGTLQLSLDQFQTHSSINHMFIMLDRCDVHRNSL